MSLSRSSSPLFRYCATCPEEPPPEADLSDIQRRGCLLATSSVCWRRIFRSKCGSRSTTPRALRPQSPVMVSTSLSFYHDICNRYLQELDLSAEHLLYIRHPRGLSTRTPLRMKPMSVLLRTWLSPASFDSLLPQTETVPSKSGRPSLGGPAITQRPSRD
jgi:hypothetical protein